MVVTIIALLATMITPRLLGNIDKTKQKNAVTETKSITDQIAIWSLERDDFSADDFEFDMITDGDDAPYKGKSLEDPWGHPYDYEIVDGQVYVKSYGRDKAEGGSGYDADVLNGEVLDNAS